MTQEEAIEELQEHYDQCEAKHCPMCAKLTMAGFTVTSD